MAAQYSQNKERIVLNGELNLKEDFHIPTYQEWRNIVEKNLKGIPFLKALVTKTYEGIDLQPIYAKEDIKELTKLNHKPGCGNYLRGANIEGYLNQPWEICQSIKYNTVNEFNKALTQDLNLGLSSINLVPDLTTRKGLDPDKSTVTDVGNDGISISHLQDLSTVFKGIDLKKHSIHITSGPSGLVMLMALASLFKQKGLPYKQMKGSINADPLASLATFGKLPLSIRVTFNHLATITDWRVKNAPDLKTIGISSLPYHNSGANAVEELACAMATGVEYINQLLDRNLRIDDIAGSIRFSFGIGPSYFIEIAKLRAARMLWAKIINIYKGNKKSQKTTIHGITSRYHQTLLDPYMNILRTATETFSAIMGGVDSLQTDPFDDITSGTNEFSRRIARNIQIILKEESHLSQFIDPSGGSYYIERLTHEMGRKAWTLFQKLEKHGGMLKAIQKGFPQKEISDTARKRRTDLAKRKSTLIGTNLFANFKDNKIKSPPTPSLTKLFAQRSQSIKAYRENRCSSTRKTIKSKLCKLKENLTGVLVNTGIDLLLDGATFGEISAIFKTDSRFSVKPLNIRRLSEDFEIIRSTVVSFGLKRGAKPRVFLIPIDSKTQCKSLTDMSRDVFETGGFEVVYPPVFFSPQTVANVVVTPGTSVAVICSSNFSDPKLISPILANLKNQNKDIIIVATGVPKEYIAELELKGLDEVLDPGADIVVFLKKVLKRMGISA